MLELLNARFAGIQDVEYLALATLLDPRYEDNFMTLQQYAKD